MRGSEIWTHPIRVARVVVVAIAVVVDIGKVRRRHDAAQPPVVAIQPQPYIVTAEAVDTLFLGFQAFSYVVVGLAPAL